MILNFRVLKSNEKNAIKIAKLNPLLVGISLWTYDFTNGIKLAEKIKEIDSKIKIVLGGPHINALPSESIAESDSVDYVLAGEAEFNLPNLINYIRNNEEPIDIPGLYYNKNGKANNNLLPEYGIDIAALPFPAWDFYPINDTYPILTERGCPYQCNFCSHNLSSNLNSRSIESVVEELKWLKNNFNPKVINIEDETFGINIKRMEALLNEIMKINHDQKIKFKAQTRVDRVNLKMLKLMKKAGFEYLELGVESGDKEVLAQSGKNIKIEQVETAVRYAKEAGIKTWCNFIIGLKGETNESVRNTINLGVKLNPSRVSVSTIVAYPGSEIYKKALREEDGFKFMNREWSSFDKYLSYSLELDTMSAKKMRMYQILAYAEIYLKNLRFIQFCKLILKYRYIAFSMLKSFFLKNH